MPRKKAPEELSIEERLSYATATSSEALMRLAPVPHAVRDAVSGGILNPALLDVVKAFNIKNNPELPYSFPDGTQDKVREHAFALMELFASGGFCLKPSPAAQSDAGFQRFMARAVAGQSSRKRRGAGRALEAVGKRSGRRGTQASPRAP